MTNKERLKRMKNSAKRIQKRSYDSDRNSFSGDGCHDRNSSESLNAAMRSVVQRSNANRRGGGVGGERGGATCMCDSLYVCMLCVRLFIRIFVRLFILKEEGMEVTEMEEV